MFDIVFSNAEHIWVECHVIFWYQTRTHCEYAHQLSLKSNSDIISGYTTQSTVFLRYGLTLDSDTSDWGYMSCEVTGTYVGKGTYWPFTDIVHHIFPLHHDEISSQFQWCWLLSLLGHQNLSYILDSEYGRFVKY